VLLFSALAVGCGAQEGDEASPLAPEGPLPQMMEPQEAPAPEGVAVPVAPSPGEGAPDPNQTALNGGPIEGQRPAGRFVLDGPGVDPVASNASPEARNLLNYLYSVYGKKMIAGQMESTWMQGGAEYEMNYIQATTGKLPAVRGLDFIEYDGVAQRAMDWWGRGGIANIRWHWGAPTHGEGYDASQEAVDIDRVLTPGTAEYDSMMASLDRTAGELTKLENANVPVLWTPFHELNGNWFWWGKETPEQFVRLWRFMFEYFDGEKGLNNLIWVLGYTGRPDADWYPGDEYVDIAGADSYGRTDAPQLNMFNAVRNIVGNEMPVTYHECGIIPNPGMAQQQGANWSWFMTWHTNWLTARNTVEHLNAVYDHDFVITLDEVPDLR
jgi:Glycosyl hydrolase family 26